MATTQPTIEWKPAETAPHKERILIAVKRIYGKNPEIYVGDFNRDYGFRTGNHTSLARVMERGGCKVIGWPPLPPFLEEGA